MKDTHGFKMNDLVFEKKQVLEALNTQLDTHKQIVKEAWEGYKEEAREQLEEALELVAKGRRLSVQVYVPAPEDHTQDIERAIKMLEMSKGHEVILTQGEFTQYVLGEWSWREQFLASNSVYSATAASAR